MVLSEGTTKKSHVTPLEIFFCKRNFTDQAYIWSLRNLYKARFLKEIMSGQVRRPFSPSNPSYGYGYSLYRRSIRIHASRRKGVMHWAERWTERLLHCQIIPDLL